MLLRFWLVSLVLAALPLIGCDDAQPAAERSAPDVSEANDATDAGPDTGPTDASPADGSPDAEPPLPCTPATATLGPEGGTLAVDTGLLSGTQLIIPAGVLAAPVAITIDCADRLVPADHAALGTAVRIQANTPTPLTNWARVQLVFDPQARPPAITANHLQLFWASDRHPGLSRPPVKDSLIDLEAGTFSFATPGLGTFQLGHSAQAGEMMDRRFTFKAIIGVSMGGGGAAYLGTKFHDRFDFVGGLGGAVDWIYLLRYITTSLTGGFCSARDEAGIGAWCGQGPPSHPYEHPVDYNHWFFADNGGAFDREEYVKIFQDLSLAYGNPLIYNAESPYRAPGMPIERLRLNPQARCAPECRDAARLEQCRAAGNCFCDRVCPDGVCPDAIAPHTIATGFFDAHYNPDGQRPVISFCDGEDGGEPGVFRDGSARDKPVEILLVVDLNGNGRRDIHEPVIRQMSEPYADLGCDGVASANEPGYDAITQPDPAGDDYDWYRNPTGTEGNWLYEGPAACPGAGEPYDDLGLDGVADTPQSSDGGYDYGEANGRFDYNPNFARIIERSPSQIWRGLTPDERARVDFWLDGGIRDIFNFGLSAMHLAGQLRAAGENIRLYDDFPFLLDNPLGMFNPSPDTPDLFGQRGHSLLIRYGTPDASPADIASGDGAHVGTALQALTRFLTLFDWLLNRWPDGDYQPQGPADRPVSENIVFDSPRTGRRYRYGVSFPPGYGRDPALRYPVMLVLHGYGQEPDDLPAVGAILAGSMGRGLWQKSLIIYPDGNCGSTRRHQCDDGLDNDGDGLIDAAAPGRHVCDGDDACDDGHSCRAGWCCPSHWAACGAPDPQCARGSTRAEDGSWPAYCADGVDNDLDGRTDLDDPGCLDTPSHDSEAECKRGSFYVDHAAALDGTPGGPEWELMMLDLLDDVDARYPTKAPAVYSVPRQ